MVEFPQKSIFRKQSFSSNQHPSPTLFFPCVILVAVGKPLSFGVIKPQVRDILMRHLCPGQEIIIENARPARVTTIAVKIRRRWEGVEKRSRNRSGSREQGNKSRRRAGAGILELQG